MRHLCKDCGHQGDRISITPSSFAVELLVWVGAVILTILVHWVFLIGGILFTLWRVTSSYKGCEKCKSKNVIPLDSPMAHAILDKMKS